MLTSVIRSVTVPPHFKPFYRQFRSQRFRMLDVGCGMHAPTKAKGFFPDCEYHGIDLNDQGLDERDRAFMTRFYRADLDKDVLDEIPIDYFDVILVSHVIEHLQHGLEAIARLASKLKPGGFIYVEFPGVRSLKAPSARRGFLHFHDDPTHVRLHTIPEVVNALLDNRCRVLKAGTRRDGIRVLMTPLLLFRGLLQGDLWSGRPWDAFGIAEFVYARKVV